VLVWGGTLSAWLLATNGGDAGEPPDTMSSQGREPPLGTEIVHPIDGALMVYVPSGWFIMGLAKDEGENIAKQLSPEFSFEKVGMFEALPKRREFTKGFFIDKYEVTIERWRRFLKANPEFEKKKPDLMKRHFDNPAAQVFPVSRVHWHEAAECANWAGKRLPTEKQWEKAARGTDGRFFPWGNTFDMSKGRFTQKDKNGEPPGYTRVGSYPEGASPCGAMDMLGNQYEITGEWKEPYPNNPEREKMVGYSSHKDYCLRGGSFFHGLISIYAAKRFGIPPDQSYWHVAFRTLWEPPEGYFETEDYSRARKAVAARKQELATKFQAFDRAEQQANQRGGR